MTPGDVAEGRLVVNILLRLGVCSSNLFGGSECAHPCSWSRTTGTVWCPPLSFSLFSTKLLQSSSRVAGRVAGARRCPPGTPSTIQRWGPAAGAGVVYLACGPRRKQARVRELPRHPLCPGRNCGCGEVPSQAASSASHACGTFRWVRKGEPRELNFAAGTALFCIQDRARCQDEGCERAWLCCSP